MNASASAVQSSDSDRRQGASILTDQAVAGIIMAELEQKQLALARNLEHISREAAADSQQALSALNEALGYVERVRDFAAPQNLDAVLGNMSSKHGEIAEQVDVQIRNARAVFDGLPPVADIDSVARTAPEDYLINGVPVQSKFVAGFNKCLDHVLDLLDKYPDFAKDATSIGYPGTAGCYIIPRDHYETITRILHGDATNKLATLLAAICASIGSKIFCQKIDLLTFIQNKKKITKIIYVQNNCGKYIDMHLPLFSCKIISAQEAVASLCARIHMLLCSAPSARKKYRRSACEASDAARPCRLGMLCCSAPHPASH